MAFDLKQSLKLTQQLLMTPQLQQAIKLLQLSRMELEEFVELQLNENPILEENSGDSADVIIQAEKEQEHTEDQAMSERMGEVSEIVDRVGEQDKQDTDWESFVSRDDAAHSSRTSGTQTEDGPQYENIITRGDTLQEHLEKQLSEWKLSDEEKRLAGIIIGNVDDKGYFTLSLEDFVAKENCSTEDAQDALETVQRFDPAGVGARDLKECLLLQLHYKKLKNGTVEKIVEFHLNELTTRNYNLIAKSLKISLENVIEHVHIISELEPIPGRQFGIDNPQYIIPDVYVIKLGDRWVVTMNEDGLPRLKTSEFYKDLMKSGQTKGQDKDYLQEKYKSAQWLIKSIQQRQGTIFKVAEKIVERQKDFFEKGDHFLKPMVLRDIADDIEMHESTVSRVTTNKYIQTPRGIFELKYFFSSSIPRSGGESLASESVKNIIEEVVRHEDVKNPLSDQQIVEILETKNIQLARRTVAKYREQLQILPSSKRKKYF